jgi:hypothetical protein
LPTSDPPTHQDIVHAVVLLEKVKELSRPSFMRKLRRDYRRTTSDDLMKAHLYLHKVCSAATAGTGAGGNVECYAISDPETIHTTLDQMNKTLDRLLDDSRIHHLEQRLGSDSVKQRLQHMEQKLGIQASERPSRQRFEHQGQSPVANTHWLYNRSHPLNDTPVYHTITIGQGDSAQDPELLQVGFPHLRTNNDFSKLTDTQLDDYLYFYKVDVDHLSTRETKIYCLRYFIIGCSKSCLAAFCDMN